MSVSSQLEERRDPSLMSTMSRQCHTTYQSQVSFIDQQLLYERERLRGAFSRAVGLVRSSATTIVGKPASNTNAVLHHDHFRGRMACATSTTRSRMDKTKLPLNCGNCSWSSAATATATKVEVHTQSHSRGRSDSSSLIRLLSPQINVDFLGTNHRFGCGRRYWGTKIPSLAKHRVMGHGMRAYPLLQLLC